ncbi:MAG: cytochrome d ubiquinol oxidase subunit II, partial [Candidatus Cybelea sp.]
YAVDGGLAGWLLALPPLSLAALAGVWWGARSQRPKRAFAMSLAFLAALLTAAAGTLFPYLLPAFPPGRGGISIFSAAPSAVALTCALSVTLGGIVIVGIYTPIVWRRMGGKLRAE